MNEFSLKLKQLHLIQVYPAASRQVVVAALEPDDAVFIHRMPFGIEASVAKREETFALPAELRDFGGCLGLLIKEHLQLGQFFFSGQPDVVTQSLYLLLELG